jgi:metal-responsive CopG/Arc/MetJ family transcriptional regulator
MSEKTVRLTASVPKDIVDATDEIAAQTKSSRSQIVADCLKEMIERRKKQALAEGYQAMAEKHNGFTALSAQAVREVRPDW